MSTASTNPVERIEAGPRMSAGVIHGDTVFLSGLIATDLDQDVTGQTAQILARVDELLAHAGTDKSKLISANIWLTDIGEWAQMNEAWDPWVSPGNTPARATVEARLAAPRAKVEIMVTAAR
jgi:enamine deaminase RidA (YjgF/YER057c/UK114 family)